MSRLSSWGRLVLAVAVVSFIVADASAQNKYVDWPQFRGPNRDGISPDTGLLKQWPKDGPPLVWKAEGIGIGFSSVSIVGERIFTMGDKDGSSWVFALERNTGKPLWSTRVGKAGGSYAGTRCTPTVDGNLVFAIGQFGDLVCLEADSGSEKWRKDFKKDFAGRHGSWQYTESPLVDGEKLLCTPGGQKTKAAIVALNKNTGEVIWESDFGETAGYASIVISEAGGVRQYVQLLSQGVAGVRAQDGKLLWRFQNTLEGGKSNYFAGNTANIPNPVVLGDYVLAGAGYGRGAGLIKLNSDGEGVKAEEVYFKRDMTNRHGGYVVIGDYVYADRDSSGNPFCANWKTGELQWKRAKRTAGRGSVAITYADGKLYMRFDDGFVMLVEATPEEFREISVFKIPNSDRSSWSHPVVVGGKLYLREKDTLWCHDVKAR